MLLARVRHFAETHHRLWCVAGVLLILLQPFIAVHFRSDGLEDEPMLRVRSASDTTQFEPDDRADHPSDRETTVFAQTPASIDHPDTFDFALSTFMAIVLAMLPLAIAVARLSAPIVREAPEHVPPHGGAPPPAQPWLRLPPSAAPPYGI
ncbi:MULTISPECIES: hypothetical protein [Variovorax]|jgi:hypothetical protein|uniref:hypothetical protein n=1 Tax=Variovorax TaxID=34072 RepID=UPI00086E3BD8|nr:MULTISPECIES: hypothetical protein [Variovorax]MBN8754493.1 hypothetical protein [Variovorax sp.]ODU17538.1 MAG: hypothetical protein ABS94_08750 [Variovorax sp. SCN 67-85]ODV24223.1 MAG: hypothetical protein ABT25_15405 [Variovorax sp. SCN 67-20]OJZ04099.1 MAG: hypothetical protein BGP22_04460 [Variovorax sp. 67-131]UKI10026.1 hypothetical protein L3V85_09310 [Variovorax paradoxus]